MPKHGRRILTPLLLITLVSVLVMPQAMASPAPSKTRAGQSLADREADLDSVRSFLARDEVARALQARGLTAGEAESRLARLSDEDLSALASNLDQVQAAGAMDRDRMWILIYILLGVLLIVLLV